MLYVLVILFSGVFSYFFLKPYKNRINPIKMFLILFPVSIIFYWLVIYFTIYSKPASFRYAIKFLEKDKTIIHKIGDYISYSYSEHDLPKKEDNPALVKVSLNGSIGKIFLSCKVQKDSLNNWHLIDVYQDSLVKNS